VSEHVLATRGEAQRREARSKADDTHVCLGRLLGDELVAGELALDRANAELLELVGLLGVAAQGADGVLVLLVLQQRVEDRASDEARPEQEKSLGHRTECACVCEREPAGRRRGERLRSSPDLGLASMTHPRPGRPPLSATQTNARAQAGDDLEGTHEVLWERLAAGKSNKEDAARPASAAQRSIASGGAEPASCRPVHFTDAPVHTSFPFATSSCPPFALAPTRADVQ